MLFQCQDKTMKVMAKEYLSFTTYFVIIGIVISCILGCILTSISLDGGLESWKPLKSPPGTVVQLLDANYQAVWVKTTENEIYYIRAVCHWYQDCWILTDGVPSNLDDYPANSSSSDEAMTENSCQFSTASFNPKELERGNITQCILVPFRGIEWYGETYFALLDDGTVWRWIYKNTSLGGIPASLITIKYPLIGGSIGVLLSICVFSLNCWLKRTKPSNS